MKQSLCFLAVIKQFFAMYKMLTISSTQFERLKENCYFFFSFFKEEGGGGGSMNDQLA